MSRPRVRARRDAPALVLAWTVPLLPAARRVWGQAMQAELAGIETSANRWRFTADCALAILRRPAFGALGSLAGLVGVVLATVLLTVRTAYLPMHIELIAMVSVLGLLYLICDRVVFFAPLATGSRLSAAVRAGGALALAWLALGIVLSFRSGDGNVVDRASSGVPICTVMIAIYLLGFMSLTSPAPAGTRVLARGVGLGMVAAVVWLVLVLARPPLPLSSRSAFAVLAVAALVAAVSGAPRGAAALTALCTGLVGALSIFVVVHLALAYGPGSWVPSDSAALTPAARLAQSRGETGDGYLPVVLAGVLSAIAILAGTIRNHRRSLLSPSRAPATGCTAGSGLELQ